MYAVQIENPRASKAVASVFAQIMGLKLDFSSLDERARIVDEEIEKLVDYFKSGASSQGPISEDEIEKFKQSLATFTKLPDSARAKIEELFKVTERDITRAPELKKELDRWHIYKDYEDRFLDLFKKNNN